MAARCQIGKVWQLTGFSVGSESLNNKTNMSDIQQIGAIIPTNLSQMRKPNLPSVSTRGGADPRVPAIVGRYRNEQYFLTLFNPSKQIAYTRDVERAFRGTAPTLELVAKAFGASTRDNWLDVQLTELAVFSGCKEKMNSHQIEALIDIITEDYAFLKVTELMYFFRQFKAGAYGKFYGSVDPLTITCALKEFSQERRAILRKFQKEDEARQEKEDPDRLHYLRVYERDARKRTFYSLNFRSDDFTFEEFEEIWWLFNLGYERNDHGYAEQPL